MKISTVLLAASLFLAMPAIASAQHGHVVRNTASTVNSMGSNMVNAAVMRIMDAVNDTNTVTLTNTIVMTTSVAVTQ